MKKNVGNYLLPKNDTIPEQLRANLNQMIHALLPEDDRVNPEVDGEALLKVIETLPERQQNVISLHYGLEAPDYSGMSLVKAGKSIGISRSMAEKDKEYALNTLRLISRKTVYHKHYQEEAKRRLAEPENNIPIEFIIYDIPGISHMNVLTFWHSNGIHIVSQLAVVTEEEFDQMGEAIKNKIPENPQEYNYIHNCFRNNREEFWRTIKAAKECKITPEMIEAAIVQYKISEDITCYAWDMENLPISKKVRYLLARNKVESLLKFISLSKEKMLYRRGIGKDTCDEVKRVRAQIGFPMED